MTQDSRAFGNEEDQDVDVELEDAGSTYECIRCDAEFTRTDEQAEEGQSTEYCDPCLRLMSNAENNSAGDDDEEDS